MDRKAIFEHSIRVLVIEPKPDLSRLLDSALAKKGFDIESYDDLDVVQMLLDTGLFDLVVFEEGANAFSDEAALSLFSESYPDIPCIFIAKNASSEAAVFGIMTRTFAVLARPFQLIQIGLVMLGAKAKRDFMMPSADSDSTVSEALPQMAYALEVAVEHTLSESDFFV